MTLVQSCLRVGFFVAVGFAAMTNASTAQVSGYRDQNRGFYIGAGAGGNFAEQNRIRGGGADSTADYNAGTALSLSLGYAMGNGLRFELEPGYRANDAGKINGVTGHGDLEIPSVMANALYDFDLHAPSIPLIPHVGAGVGWAHPMNHTFVHNGLTINGSDNVVAAQAIAGIEYPLSASTKLGLDYRYFLAHDANFHVASTGAATRLGDLNNHSVMLTLRYAFGAPQPQPAPPPPPPTPQAAPAPMPPAPPQSYIVYFDLDKATLTEAARSIVKQAAASAERGNVTRIVVTGYTDTSGTVRHNQGLSERRATTVRQELIRDGVSGREIETVGRGENDLAVPTADGVVEPRNRRVTIMFQTPGT